MADPKPSQRVQRYRRMTLWTLALMLTASLALPLGGYLYSDVAHAQDSAAEDSNPRANYWRAVREGNTGYSAVTGRSLDGGVINAETGTLIQNSGQNWRQYRNGWLANYGGWVLFASLMIVVLFFALKGRIKIAGGRSGYKVKRWSGWDRFLHWYTAILFVVLTVTGLSLLFGRAVLIPLMGPKGFSLWAGFAKTLHDIGGPLFSLGVLLMIASWVQHNMIKGADFKWLFKGGGLIGNAHVSSGRLNAGEKIWFWFICLAGMAVIVTGFMLDFPTMGLSREVMQISSLIHAALAIFWIAFWIGHAYIGTMGTEGALEGMTTGYVDTNWAKQHHDAWYDEVRGEEIRDDDVAGGSLMAAAVGGAAAAATAASGGQWVPEDSVLRRHYEAARASGAS